MLLLVLSAIGRFTEIILVTSSLLIRTFILLRFPFSFVRVWLEIQNLLIVKSEHLPFSKVRMVNVDCHPHQGLLRTTLKIFGLLRNTICSYLFIRGAVSSC